MGEKKFKLAKEKKWLVVIMLLGIFLRIYSLGAESFWLDESETVYGTTLDPSTIIHNIYTKVLAYENFVYTKGGSMPLYYLTAYFWTKLVGLSEFKLRLLSAIFGTLSIYLVYVIGKEFFSEKVGLVAAFILSINHQHIYYSQEARAYSLLVFVTMLSVYFFYRMLVVGKYYNLILYSLGTAAVIYTHYYGFFILFFQGIFLLVFFKDYIKKIKHMVLSWLIVFLVYLPWMPAFIKQFSEGEGINIIHGGITLTKIARLFISMNSWISFDFQTRYALVNSQYFGISALGALTIMSVLLISLVFLCLFLMALFLFFRKYAFNSYSNKPLMHKYVLIILWFLVPVIAPLLISIIFPESSSFGPIRYVLFATPAYYILISKSISEFSSKKAIISRILGRKIYSFQILVIIAVLSVMPLYSYYVNYDKGQYREAAEYLSYKAKEGDTIIIHGAPILLPFGYYYSGYPNKSMLHRSFSIEELKKFASSKNEFWVVASMLKYYDPKNEFQKYIEKDYIATEKKEFIDVKVIKYKKASLVRC